MVGNFAGTVSFGAITLTSIGTADVFVAKWNGSGAGFAWAQQAGGSGGSDAAFAVATSGNNVYITGSFTGVSVAFGNTVLINTPVSGSSSYTDVFVAKLTDAGTTASFVWAQRAGGVGGDGANAIAVSGSSVYVAGLFQGATAGFGSITLSNSSTSGSYQDMFVAKLTDAGSSAGFAWARQAGGPGDDVINSLAVLGTSIYVGGYFNSPTLTWGGTTLVCAGGLDMLMAKLTDTGPSATLGWAQRAGGTGDDLVGGLAANAAGVYMAGSFQTAAANFGGITLVTAGATDAVVAKLVDDGNTSRFAWARRAGGIGDDYASKLAVSGAALYVAGAFLSTPAAFGSTALSSVGGSDVYVARLTDRGNAGEFDWAQRGGGIRNEVTTSLAQVGTTVYVGGTFSTVTSFGNFTLANPNATTVSFVASIIDALALATTIPPMLAAFIIVPNPAHATVTVQLPPVPGATTATLTLLDALGRTLRTQMAATNAKAELDLTGFAPGLYAVRVVAGGSTATRRLVVE